jgi:predicted transcriptional regulator
VAAEVWRTIISFYLIHTRMREPIDPTPLEEIARRSELINRILEGRTRKRELKSTLEVSDSTLNRAIRCLEEEGIIRCQNGDYTVTSYGRFVLSEYERLADRYDTFNDAKPLLRELESDTLLDREAIQNADVILADYPDPRAPITKLENLVEGHQSITALTSVIQPRFLNRMYEYLKQGTVEVDLIMETDQVEHLFASYDWVRDMMDLQSCTIRRIEDSPDLGVVLVDEDYIWIGVYGQDNTILGAILNDTSPAIEWGREILQEYRSEGNPVLSRSTSTYAQT